MTPRVLIWGLGRRSPVTPRRSWRRIPPIVFDENATTKEQNEVAQRVDPSDAFNHYARNTPLVQQHTIITDDEWQLLRAENEAYHKSLTANAIWQYRLGLAGVALIITMLLAGYVARYQSRCVRNHARGIAMAALLLSMLLLTQLAGIGSSSLYIFGIAPTIVAAMILTIAYDQRFAMGVATMHGMHRHHRSEPGHGVFPHRLGRRADGVLPAR